MTDAARKSLARLGLSSEQAAALRARPGLRPGRVAVQHRGAYDVLTADGEVRATVTPALRRSAGGQAGLPVVGDWVGLADGLIELVAPRRTAFVRKLPGEAAAEQVVAANVDVCLLVEPLSLELNRRRLERALTLAWESGAEPVVVLSKADLCDEPGAAAEGAREIAGDVPVLVVSSITGMGIDSVRAQLAEGRTAVLLGPSGAGKSTLANVLAGEQVASVGEVRASDQRGRHTTIRRQLLVLPGGALLLDTPGMRELGLWEAEEGLERSFPDVEELAARCRFSDCRHDQEPGCAVREGVGRERLEAWRRLRDELEELDRRRVVAARRRGRRGGIQG